MLGIKFFSKGDYKKTTAWLNKLKSMKLASVLDKYGQKGVEALAQVTPVDSGKTAASWNYKIEYSKDSASIIWTNSNVNKGVNIAIILYYGHGTGTGGYVQGRDYITPAIRPIFDEISKSVWKEVTMI